VKLGVYLQRFGTHPGDNDDCLYRIAARSADRRHTHEFDESSDDFSPFSSTFLRRITTAERNRLSNVQQRTAANTGTGSPHAPFSFHFICIFALVSGSKSSDARLWTVSVIALRRSGDVTGRSTMRTTRPEARAGHRDGGG